jgi:hypothetical protein
VSSIVSAPSRQKWHSAHSLFGRVLCTFLLGRVVRIYNKEFFYLTIIPICICSIALRAFTYFITSLQFYHSHVGLYFVRQSRALVGEYLGFVVSDEPKSGPFFPFDIARFDIDPDSRRPLWYVHGGRSYLG